MKNSFNNHRILGNQRVARFLASGLVLFLASNSVLMATPEFDSATKLANLKKSMTYPARKLSISFRNADVKDILRFFASELKVNIIPSTEVKGLVSFDFDSINPVDAMDSMLVSQGYDWHEDNGVIYVSPSSP